MSLASSGGYTVDGSPSTVVPANCSIARVAPFTLPGSSAWARHLVENAEMLWGQCHLQAGEVAFEVFQPPGSDDRHDGL